MRRRIGIRIPDGDLITKLLSRTREHRAELPATQYSEGRTGSEGLHGHDRWLIRSAWRLPTLVP